MQRFFPFVLLSLIPVACAQPGIISTVMGNGVPFAAGCSGAAVSAGIRGTAASVTADAAGILYVYDGDGHICKVSASGGLSTLRDQPMQGPIALDGQGNLYFASGGFVAKMPAGGGAPAFIAGGFIPGYSGDGGLATAAALNPTGVVFEQSTGRIYIADTLNHRIRMIAPSGITTTIAGTGVQGFSGDGGLATAAQISLPQGMAMDTVGNLYFCALERVRRINTNTGIITTVAGNGSVIGLGENVPATSTGLGGPTYVAVDEAGTLHISETGVNRIRRVNAQGLISTISGQGIPGFSGDGGPATAAFLFGPSSMSIDSAGNIYFVDQFNNRIRKINGSPTITVDPGELTFSSQNGSTPPNQTVNVTTTGSGGFTVTVATASGGNWLSATPTSGTLPATLTISANPTGLLIGSYSGTVTITAPGTSNSPKVIPVTLNVSGASVPNITAVVNASGYQAKLAPGVVFTIFGTFLGPASLTVAPAPNYPLGLSTTSVRFSPSGGGAATSARMIYTSSGQVAGHLPSSVTPGVYQVRVTYLGATSDPFNVTVVARSIGIAAANSAGSGPAQASIATVNGGLSLIRNSEGTLDFGGFTWRLTPARGGDIIVFWGTGGGADLANDTGGSSGNQTAAGSFFVTIGGRSITPQYAGTSSGFPGLWQVNVPLPADIATSCTVPVLITGGGEPSNAVTIAIAGPGQTTCGP